MSQWIPGYERRYNEFVPQDLVYALNREYQDYSIPTAMRMQNPYPRDATTADVISDTLYLIPRIPDQSIELSKYFSNVVAVREESQP